MRLLKFTASWCSACKAMDASVRQLASEQHLALCEISLETPLGQRLADIADVKSLPTFVLITDTATALDKLTADVFASSKIARGQMPKAQLARALGFA